MSSRTAEHGPENERRPAAGSVLVERLELPDPGSPVTREARRGNLRLVVPEANVSPPERREVYVASVRWQLAAVSPRRDRRARAWMEMLDLFAEADPKLVLQLRLHGGRASPAVELALHTLDENEAEASHRVRQAGDRLGELWRLLGGAWVWQEQGVSTEAALSLPDRYLCELFPVEHQDDGRWGFRAYRCLLSDLGERDLPLGLASLGPFVLATSLRPCRTTPEEQQALVRAGELAFGKEARGFEARLHLASEQPLAPEAVRLLGQRLLGRTGLSGALDHGALDSHVLDRGGFAVLRPETEEAVRLALANLRHGAMQSWEPSSAPAALQRARRLVAVVPALTVFPVPVLPGTGLALPVPERLPACPGVVLGRVGHGADARDVVQSDADAAQHTYLVGKTGTGKSTLLLHQILGRITEGHGVVVLDPHGDLALDVVSRVPEHRVQDTILFDPTDLEWPIGLNLLEHDPARPEQKSFLLNELLSMIDDLYDLKETGGPIFELVFRNGFLALMDTPGSSIADLSRFLSDKAFREQVLGRCQNARVRRVFQGDLEKVTGEYSLQNIAHYITSKLDAFVGNAFLLPIVGQAKSGIDFAGILDRRKILVVRLNKGRLGAIGTHLLGMVMLARLMAAALGRSDRPVDARPPCHVFVDEFQNLMTRTMAQMLSEARKYGLRLTMAHQHVGQLRPDLRAAVLGNVGTTVAFRVGPDDARLLAQATADPELAELLPGLPNHHAAVRATAEGEQLPPFVMRTLPPPAAGSAIRIERVRLASRRLGRPRGEVMRGLECEEGRV